MVLMQLLVTAITGPSILMTIGFREYGILQPGYTKSGNQKLPICSSSVLYKLCKLLTFYGIYVARQVAQTLSLLTERPKWVIVKIKHKRKLDLKIP